ncbi:MAG TPA: VCBS repeat-containing protein [Candidatus Limnocylindrales bacterium]|nr:VCBS repeat-containing protein [Candidatus Limnocylindrales bacterium]
MAPVIALSIAVASAAVPPPLARANLFAQRGAGIEGSAFGGGSPEEWKQAEAAWRQMIASEDLIDLLGLQKSDLVHSMRNLRLPDAAARRWFSPQVEVVDIAEGALSAAGTAVGAGVRRLSLPLAAQSSHSRESLDLWKPWLQDAVTVDSAGFGVLSGRFLDSQRLGFETVLKLEARSRLRSGVVVWVHGTVRAHWERSPQDVGLAAESWRIRRWETLHLEAHLAERTLFREVLDSVTDADAAARARRSVHEELVSRFLADPKGFVPPHPLFAMRSWDRHPAVSVVDIDMDGDDDFYATEREGTNLLFVNRGDGTFEEKAAAFGLDLAGNTTVAIFADFDNDGDPDLFAGRHILPSMLLRNDDGRFTDISAQAAPQGLPPLVTSATAVDYDNDGLLDIYAATYAAEALMREVEAARSRAGTGAPMPDALLAAFLPPRDAVRLRDLAASPEANEFRNLPGPPNVLLHNDGDLRMSTVAETPLRLFYNTYQATWADYDRDGDADVYVANDFAIHHLMRNDGGGRFTDVSAQTGTSDIGFGMGVSWSDYDLDGRQDLYVTNMYSKAGSRITSQLPVNPELRKMARGNSLFRNEGAIFRKVSGEGPGEVPVEVAGWSWGAQFADFDNDTRPDIYALSGNYTAPKEHQLPVDI